MAVSAAKKHKSALKIDKKPTKNGNIYNNIMIFCAR